MANVTNEVLAERLANTSVRLDKIDTMLDGLPNKLDGKFVSHDVFELRMKELDTVIIETKKDIAKLQARKQWQTWALGTLSAAAGGAMVAFINFITHHVH